MVWDFQKIEFFCFVLFWSLRNEIEKILAFKTTYFGVIIINPWVQILIEFVSLFTILSTTIKCKSCKSNVTFGESNIRRLGFNLVVNCKNCEPRYISKKSKWRIRMKSSEILNVLFSKLGFLKTVCKISRNLTNYCKTWCVSLV